MSSSTETHGLAGKIRSSKESETFDLAGMNSTTITSTIKDAFSTPFEDLPDDVAMIRITLVTGAGKLGRSRYDENAAKIVGQELRAVGYEQDSSASCVKACGGSFKSQHDTGKNLKTIVVFPKVIEKSTTGGDGGDSTDDLSGGGISNLWSKQEEMIVSCPNNIFENLVKKNCPSWSEKKCCSLSVTRIQELVSGMEERLIQGQVLTDAEQELYDSVPTDSLKEKHTIVRNLMQDQVELGNITQLEKTQLIAQAKERLQGLQDELDTAKAEGKPKKVEKLSANKTKLEARVGMLEKTTAKPPRPLKYQAEIGELQKELTPLLKLEEGAKGRLLSVKETQQLGRKDDILEEIQQLQEDSRGLFESDESFDDRVQLSNKSLQTKQRQGGKGKVGSSKKPATAATTKRSTGGANAWTTTTTSSLSKPISRRPVGGQPKTTKTSKKSGGGGAGGLFAAMMLDDDSDSD
mmetsp:Transcript_175/g.362  ORF Transcript_175/g.362 Transcript_175/m.362 type:complete len:464 (+) Transcript_175:64-1455(+)